MDSFEVEEKKNYVKKKTKKKKNFVSESIFEQYLPRSRKQSIQKFLIHKKI